MPEATVRIMLTSLPRIVSDLIHAAARLRRDVVLIDRGDHATADLTGDAVSAGADVVITSVAAGDWPGDCATLVTARSAVTVYAVDAHHGRTRTLESRELGELSPGELLVSAVDRVRSAR